MRANVAGEPADGRAEPATTVCLDDAALRETQTAIPDDRVDGQLGDIVPASLTFVDLYSQSRRLDNWTPELGEQLTELIQNRLHIASSTDCWLLRWPWITCDNNIPGRGVSLARSKHCEAIEAWLDRLTGSEIFEPVIASTVKNVGVLLHGFGTEPLVIWRRREQQWQEQRILAYARALELSALLNRRNAIWEPRSYHYRLPSGEHTDLFIRVADALHGPSDASALVCWLTPYVRDQICVIADTAGMTPLLLQIDNLMSKFGLEVGPMSIVPEYPVGRPQIKSVVEDVLANSVSDAEGSAGGLLVLLSVSSTGVLKRLFCDELDRVPGKAPSALEVLVDRMLAPGQSGHTDSDGCVSITTWLGLGRPASSSAYSDCQLCRDPEKSQVVAIDPRSYGAISLPKAHLVMPDVKYAEDAHRFWELVNDTRGVAIEAKPHPASRAARPKRAVLPVRPIFERLVSSDKLDSAVQAQKKRLWPRCSSNEPEWQKVGLVISVKEDISAVPAPLSADGDTVDLAERLRVVMDALDIRENTTVVAISRNSEETEARKTSEERLTAALNALDPGDSILVFSWGTVTGLTLRDIKIRIAEMVAKLNLQNCVNALVLHSRPSSPGEWAAIQNQFRPGGLWSLWTSCLSWRSPLQDERWLLDRSAIDRERMSKLGRQFLDHRLSFLSLHEVHLDAEDDWSPRFDHGGNGPDPTHLFWGMSPADAHQDRVRGRSLYGAELDCVSAYGAIGAVVNHTRLATRPDAAPRWVMFNLARIVRSYFDAIIVCALLRWMHPGELWWGDDTSDPKEARDSVKFLIDQAGNDLSEQVLLLPELLLATALGKLPSTATDLVCESAEGAFSEWRSKNRLAAACGAIEVGLQLVRGPQYTSGS